MTPTPSAGKRYTINDLALFLKCKRLIATNKRLKAAKLEAEVALLVAAKRIALLEEHIASAEGIQANDVQPIAVDDDKEGLN